MALPGTGAISMNDIHLELGGTTGTTVSLGDTDVHTLLGAYDMNSAHGKSSAPPWNTQTVTLTSGISTLYAPDEYDYGKLIASAAGVDAGSVSGTVYGISLSEVWHVYQPASTCSLIIGLSQPNLGTYFDHFTLNGKTFDSSFQSSAMNGSANDFVWGYPLDNVGAPFITEGTYEIVFYFPSVLDMNTWFQDKYFDTGVWYPGAAGASPNGSGPQHLKGIPLSFQENLLVDVSGNYTGVKEMNYAIYVPSDPGKSGLFATAVVNGVTFTAASATYVFGVTDTNYAEWKWTYSTAAVLPTDNSIVKATLTGLPG